MHDPFDEDGASDHLDIELDVDPAAVRREQEFRPVAPATPPAGPGAPGRGPGSPRAGGAVPPVAARESAPGPGASTSPRGAWVPPAAPDESPSNLRTFIILGVLGLIIAVNVYIQYWDDWFPPDPAEIVARLSEDPDGVLLFDGETYSANWNMEPEIVGYVHQVGRVRSAPAEFITHQLILVTGEYADPSKVEITDMEDGNVSWKAPTQPKGSIEMLYVIPADATALAEMKKLQPGAWVFLDGDLLDGTLVTPDEVVIKTLGGGKIFRLRAVSVETPPDE